MQAGLRIESQVLLHTLLISAERRKVFCALWDVTIAHLFNLTTLFGLKTAAQLDQKGTQNRVNFGGIFEGT